MFNGLLNAVGPMFGSVASKAIKFSPELYLGAGIASGIGAAVLLARGHARSWDLRDEFDADAEAAIGQAASEYIDEYIPEGELPVNYEHVLDEMGQKEIQRAMIPVYVKTGKRVVANYGPAILLGGAAVFFVLASHGVMKGRTRNLAGTIIVLEEAFRNYRDRVVDKYGEDVDRQLRYGLEERPVIRMTKDENGKVKKVKEVGLHIPENFTPQLYEVVFDQSCPFWSPNPESALFAIQTVERTMQVRYQHNGFVLLNDVYKELGFQRTAPGAVVGWHKEAEGDSEIKFDIVKSYDEELGAYVWILNFNVHGSIFEYLPMPGI